MLEPRFFLPALTGLLTAVLTFAPLYYLSSRPVDLPGVELRVPGQDSLPPEGRVNYSSVRIGEFLQKFSEGFSSDMNGSWPGFRGPETRNVSTEKIALLDSFSDQGPPVLWRIALGEGHAAPAIHRGRFFLMDYLEKEKADALRCFSLLDGKELWRRFYRIDIKRNHGYSRTVPAVNDDCVVAVGPMGHVMAVEVETGRMLWSMDLINRFKGTVPQWYTGQCPLIDENRVILAPGGDDALLLAVDLRSGEILWQTPNPQRLKMSHASIVPMTHNGVKMYVYSALGGMVGVRADGPEAGEVLWQIPDWGATVVAPSPVILPGGRIFQSAGYGAGSILVKLSGDRPPFSAGIEKRYNPRQGLATEQQTAIFYDNVLFGILPKDSGTRRMMLVAALPEDPTSYLFDGDVNLRFGLGPLLVADGKFFALADDGHLSLLTFSGREFKRHGHSKVMPGVDAWGPLAIADGLLLLRDSTSLACVDLTADRRWAEKVGKQ